MATPPRGLRLGIPSFWYAHYFCHIRGKYGELDSWGDQASWGVEEDGWGEGRGEDPGAAAGGVGAFRGREDGAACPAGANAREAEEVGAVTGAGGWRGEGRFPEPVHGGGGDEGGIPREQAAVCGMQ